MRGGSFRSILFFLPLGILLLGAPVELLAAAKNDSRLSGQISNDSGAPLAGARVWVVSRSNARTRVRQFTTDRNGRFEARALPAGRYAVRVSLESFEPHVENEVRLRAGEQRRLTVRLRPESERGPEARRRGQKERAHEDWLWVLRARASLRSVLHFGPAPKRSPEGGVGPGRHGRVEVVSTAGPSDRFLGGSLQARIAYQVPLGQPGRLVVVAGAAGQDAPGAVLETRWQPQDRLSGPEFFLGVREHFLPADYAAAGSQSARGVRVFRVGLIQRVVLPAGVEMDYSVDYVAARIGSTARAVRPAVRLRRALNQSTVLHYAFSSAPAVPAPGAGDPAAGTGVLVRALAESHSLPGLSRRGGVLRLERRAHQEAGVEHRFASGGRFQVAVFHDRVRDAALAGEGSVEGLDPDEFLFNRAGSGFFYDGGTYATTGLRVACLFRWFDRVDSMVSYVRGGGLALAGAEAEPDQPLPLQDRLETQRAHAVTARLSAQLPGSNTQVRVGYGWVSAPLLTLLDEAAEGDTRAHPYLNLRVQQPLPSFFLIPPGLAVLADVRNLFAQGSAEVTLPEGRSVRLIPLHRSFRGGVVYQF